MENKYYRISTSYGYVMRLVVGAGAGEIPKGATHVEIGTEVYGPWRQVGPNLLKRAGLRKWQKINHHNEFDYEIFDYEIIENCFSLALGENDICLYCGFDNGPKGEHRMGWDCGLCGGN